MAEPVVRERRIPASQALREADSLNPMFLDQLRREDYRHTTVFDVGTGNGRVAWVVAPQAHRVVGVDRDGGRLMEARAYAGVRGFPRVEFVLGDVEATPWNEWHPAPFDFVLSNLCMSPAIVFRASRHLREGGKLILCAHETAHWRETARGSSHAFSPGEMVDLLEANGFATEFLGVDRTAVECRGLLEAERVLGPGIVRKWVGDGRWEGLADAFARGTREITLSYLVAKARKLAHGPVGE